MLELVESLGGDHCVSKAGISDGSLVAYKYPWPAR